MSSPLYTHFRTVGWENAEMTMILEAHVKTKGELLGLEKTEILKYIGTDLCLNHNRPIITPDEKKQADKEYGKVRRQEKKDEEIRRVKQWRIANPEKYAEQCRRYREKARLKKNLPE
jgi:hypothetical protein